jgi:hypothetical protein
MDKNWLIRTKSNHILGPVSKDKVLELYQNGSIKADDEICSGNGFWFYIREEDMINRYLKGTDVQSFNPMSEAKDVLTSGVKIEDIPEPSDDITLVGGVDLSALKEPAPAVSEVPRPKVPEAAPEKKEAQVVELKKKLNPEPKPKKPRTPKPALKKQSYLKYVGIIGFFILFLLVYFRKSIIQTIFHGELTSSFRLIDEAVAQEEVPAKKKSF